MATVRKLNPLLGFYLPHGISHQRSRLSREAVNDQRIALPVFRLSSYNPKPNRIWRSPAWDLGFKNPEESQKRSESIRRLIELRQQQAQRRQLLGYDPQVLSEAAEMRELLGLIGQADLSGFSVSSSLGSNGLPPPISPEAREQQSKKNIRKLLELIHDLSSRLAPFETFTSGFIVVNPSGYVTEMRLGGQSNPDFAGGCEVRFIFDRASGHCFLLPKDDMSFLVSVPSHIQHSIHDLNSLLASLRLQGVFSSAISSLPVRYSTLIASAIFEVLPNIKGGAKYEASLNFHLGFKEISISLKTEVNSPYPTHPGVQCVPILLSGIFSQDGDLSAVSLQSSHFEKDANQGLLLRQAQEGADLVNRCLAQQQTIKRNVLAAWQRQKEATKWALANPPTLAPTSIRSSRDLVVVSGDLRPAALTSMDLYRGRDTHSLAPPPPRVGWREKLSWFLGPVRKLFRSLSGRQSVSQQRLSAIAQAHAPLKAWYEWREVRGNRVLFLKASKRSVVVEVPSIAGQPTVLFRVDRKSAQDGQITFHDGSCLVVRVGQIVNLGGFQFRFGGWKND